MKGILFVTATDHYTINVAGIAKLYQYLSDGRTNGYTMAQFTSEWRKLDGPSKKQLLGGILDHTLTY